MGISIFDKGFKDHLLLWYHKEYLWIGGNGLASINFGQNPNPIDKKWNSSKKTNLLS